MKTSFDVALDIQFFRFALAVEIGSNFLVKIPGLFGIELDLDLTDQSWGDDLILPIGCHAAARGADVVNGQRLLTDVFKTECCLGNLSLL